MKKFFFFIATGLLVSALCGCSDSKDEEAPIPLAKPVLSEGEVTRTSIAVSWTPVAKAASYVYEVSAGETQVATDQITDCLFELSGLESGMEYSVKVKAVPAIADYIESEYAEMKVSTLPGLPRLATPVLSLPEIVGTSLTVTWEPIENALSYEYEVLKGEESVVVDATDECRFQLSDLQVGAVYLIRVRALPVDAEVYSESEYSESEIRPEALATYAVGDFYNYGGVKGIVYFVDPESNGTHGMVVSLDETYSLWASRFDDISEGNNSESDRANGRVNMDRIRGIAQWQRFYPGFAWVEEKNVDGVTGWYVPAYSELQKVFAAYNGGESGRNEEARAAFNEKLVANGGVGFEVTNYWSSTQFDSEMSYSVKFSFGSEPLYKNVEHPLRAVHAFPVPQNTNPDPGKGIIDFSLSNYEVGCNRLASKPTLTISPATAELAFADAAWCKCSRNGRKLIMTVEANTTGAPRTAKIEVTSTKNSAMKRTITVTQGAYAVGDFYDVGGVKGVVCSVQGEHGTALSMDETSAVYSTEVGENVGTNSWSDGLFNYNVVIKRENWKERYPAFAWCDAKNSEGQVKWYLPALNEAMAIYDNSTAINRTLGERGGTKINTSGKYWSSTGNSSNVDFAWFVDYGSWSYEVRDAKEKTTTMSVRAVYAF